MPILLKTQIERTAKAPIPACHARVGSLCRFLDAAEHVPTGHQKTGRYANVREHCGHGKRRKRTAAGEFWQRKKPQTAKQEIVVGAVLLVAVSIDAIKGGSLKRKI